MREGCPALLALVLIGLLAGGCGAEPVEKVPSVRPIKILELTGQRSTRRLEYPGRVSPITQTELSFEVPGRIAEFPVREGQKMSKGDLIARLDDRNYQAELAASRARRNSAKADYERFRDLFERNAASQRDMESRERNYEVAKANLIIAEKALEDTELRAHFSGRIARKLADDFQNVVAKQAIVLLQDDSVLEIKVDVPERDLASDIDQADLVALTRQLAPIVSITSIPGSSFPARFKELATAADPATRTFQVTLSFEQSETTRILPGMTARASVDRPAIEASPEGSFEIPANAAAIDDQGSHFVWRVDPSSMQVEALQVELASMQGGQVTVSGELSDGDLIAISGVNQLREGMVVRRLP